MTELTLAQACNETRKFGRMLKGLERLADVADALESADQAVADRRREEQALIARIEDRTAHLAIVEGSITAAVAKRIEVEREATDTAAQILAAAREEAEKTLAAARATENDARNAAQGVIARAAAAERQRKSAQDELAAVESRLEQAKAEGRKIFGT